MDGTVQKKNVTSKIQEAGKNAQARGLFPTTTPHDSRSLYLVRASRWGARLGEGDLQSQKFVKAR
jgi:hypothetical protein